MSNTLKDEIYSFVSGLPEWQKILAAHLLQLTEQELKRDDTIQCSLEALLVESKLTTAPATSVKYTIPEKSNDSANGSTSKFFLSSISNVQNLNALNSGQTLPIAETGLTVIYGENGVGKSGYGRLFNSAFYSRGDKTLIGNVYGPTKNQAHSAVFEFIDGNRNKVSLKYPDQKTHPAFVQFSAFDSKSVSVHIDNQNELHVQPSELNFFEALIQLINLVCEKLDAIAKSKRPENQFPKVFPEDSTIKTQVTNLSSKTDIQALTKLATLTDDETKRIAELETKKASFSLTEMEKNKTRLNGIKTRVATLKTKTATIETAFSTEKIEYITKAIIRYEELKAEVSKNGVDQFSDPRFKGIGSDLWQQFIKSAKELAELPGEPTDPANACPYCRQDLTNEAVQLIERYAQFLDSKARDAMTKALEWGKTYLINLERVEIPVILQDEAFYLWATEKHQATLNQIVSNFNNATPVKAGAIAAIKEWDKTKVISLNSEAIDWTSLETALDAEILELNEEKIKAETKVITDELLILNHRKTLAGLIPNITAYVDGLKYADQIEALKKQIGRGTKNITDKATDLHERYISNRYVQLFKQECIDLNIPCPDLSPVGTKGKTKRKYSIVGEAPSKVLSEGEQRAVALADFFTEAQISEMCGLIFDDPVNSQDHKRKGNIAKRLAAESKKRQVIVFTHDLLFLNDLVMAADENGVTLTCHWMTKNNKETGVIFPNTTPDVEKSFVDAKVAKEKLHEANRTQNPLDAMRNTREGLSALRASYEAFVIKNVFAGVVKRFSRVVRHQEMTNVYAPMDRLNYIYQKIKTLSGLTEAHLQLDTSIPEVTPQLLEQEISDYENFSSDFDQEKKAALKSFREAKGREATTH